MQDGELAGILRENFGLQKKIPNISGKFRNIFRGFVKGWFPKGWFWWMFPGPQNPERGPKKRNDGPPKPERGYKKRERRTHKTGTRVHIRQGCPFRKPPSRIVRRKCWNSQQKNIFRGNFVLRRCHPNFRFCPCALQTSKDREIKELLCLSSSWRSSIVLEISRMLSPYSQSSANSCCGTVPSNLFNTTLTTTLKKTTVKVEIKSDLFPKQF